MEQDNLTFIVTNDNGMDIECNVISIVKNEENETEPYVIFTDNSLDDNDNFFIQYGKLTEIDGDYVLKKVEDEEIVFKIQEALKDEILEFINNE